MKKLANILRLFWGCVFLAGGVFNLVMAIINKIFYNNVGTSDWPDVPGNFWTNFLVHTIIPNMLLFSVLLGVIALILGLLILSKGRWARLGLIGAVILGAVPLLMRGQGAGQLAFEAMMVYCLFFNYDKTFWRTIRRKKDLTQTSVIGS